MSRLDQIKSQSASVVSANGTSEAWSYVKLTSTPSEAGARTYSLTWIPIYGLPTKSIVSELFDQERQVYKAVYVSTFRTAERPVLSFGDKLRDPSLQEWAVTGISSSGPGTVAYTLSRDIPLIATADRKAGL